MVSPQLQRALIGLDDAVKLLSGSMDAVVFRDTWKAIALAINRHLYNEVATETRFSHQVQCVCDACLRRRCDHSMVYIGLQCLAFRLLSTDGLEETQLTLPLPLPPPLPSLSPAAMHCHTWQVASLSQKYCGKKEASVLS